ncbi:50S ribosomal protein L16 [Candidatus Woesearchaeota archaeon]|nr:50S ribosomal protein L16 [Candidatus Woesearchaeota archaeon]
MAKLRKFCSYRRLERPYTRKSKYREKSYIRASPASKVVRYEMGTVDQHFSTRLELVAKTALQIRHNAIESARQSSNRYLEKIMGKGNYHMKIMIYPHHILRENPLASGAGADRMSTGMKLSFGKPIGSAAQVKRGQTLILLRCEKQHLEAAREAMRRAANKFPCSCSVRVS